MKTFISYSRNDKEKANEFADLLRLHYIDFFLDERGGRADDQIFGAIDDCKKFAVLVSKNSLKRKWVRDEVAYAIESEKSITSTSSMVRDAASSARLCFRCFSYCATSIQIVD